MTQTANLGKRKKGLDRMKTAMERTGMADSPLFFKPYRKLRCKMRGGTWRAIIKPYSANNR